MVLVLEEKQELRVKSGEEEESFLKREVLAAAIDVGPVLGP